MRSWTNHDKPGGTGQALPANCALLFWRPVVLLQHNCPNPSVYRGSRRRRVRLGSTASLTATLRSDSLAWQFSLYLQGRRKVEGSGTRFDGICFHAKYARFPDGNIRTCTTMSVSTELPYGHGAMPANYLLKNPVAVRRAGNDSCFFLRIGVRCKAH